jgi:hypothetical protein
MATKPEKEETAQERVARLELDAREAEARLRILKAKVEYGKLNKSRNEKD